MKKFGEIMCGKNILSILDRLVEERKNNISHTYCTDDFRDKKVYYISSGGDDSNDGLTEKSPWKTIDKINSMGNALNGSVIRFRCNDVFRGNVTLQNGITYTSFGSGNKPIIIGSPENGADESKWILVDKEKSIWKYLTLLKDVGTVVFNGGESFATKLIPEIIEKNINGEIFYEYNRTYNDLNDSQFICVFDVKRALNDKEFKKSCGELYLRCDRGNPGNIYNSVEFNTYGYIFDGSNYYDGCNTDITIDNLKLLYTGGHGIGCSSAENLTVQNCEIGWIGGAVMTYYKNEKDKIFYRAGRYGNGVEVTGFCNGYTVKNCYIHDIYDAGVTHQNGRTNYTQQREYKNVCYTENLIERCCYSVEYFAHDSSDGKHSVIMKNIEISNNIMRCSGMGLCEQRVSENFIGDSCDGKLGFNLGSHINGWYNAENNAVNFVIKNNIFDRTIPNEGKRRPSGLIIISSQKEECLPEMSGNTYINYYGKNFAYFGVNTDMFVWNAQTDENTEEFVLNILKDKNGKVFFAD